MKKIAYLTVFAIIAALSCSQNDTETQSGKAKPQLKALSVQVGSSFYHAVIDHYAQRAEIGAIEDLSSITAVEYELATATATIWPDPNEFVGNWQKSQTVVVADNGMETPYEIVFTYYDDEPSVKPKPEEPAEPEEKILFFDDFDEGEHPNEEYWKLCEKANSAWNQHFVNDRDWANETLDVIDGVSVLVLTAQKVNGEYSNAGIRSNPDNLKVGLNTRLEVRARFEKAGGGFPAIWQMPVKGKGWPSSGEIDLMEWVQSSPNTLWHTIHVATSATDNTDRNISKKRTTVNETDVYRIYAVERTAEAVTFLVDGEEVWSYVNEHLDDGGIQYPFDSYEYDIILNYSFGGPLANGSMTWPGAIKDADFPARMYVDWVKVVDLSEDEEEVEE